MISYGPIAIILAGVFCLLAAVRVLIQQRRIVEMLPSSGVEISLPSKWDDTEITKVLQRHSDRPAVLSHAVASIKARMILNQDLKTAQHRLRLLTSVIEVFKLNKEMQTILQDLQLSEKEFEIQQVESETRFDDAKEKNKSEQHLRLLRQQRDEMQLQKEIAQLKSDTAAISGAPKSSDPVTPEQRRARDKKDCDDRLANLKAEKQNALKIDDPAERVLRVNALDDAIQREYERWAKLL